MSTIAPVLRALPARATVAVALLAGLLGFAVAATATASGSDGSALLVGAVAIALSAALAVRAAVAVGAVRILRLGHRAERHRESLSRTPAPTHPGTAGRPRPRAPGAAA